jgi:signal recognition particle receptor subunit beta
MVLGKVLVVGAGEAGKSTLIGLLCEGALNLEVGGRTVAFDHGMLRRGNDALSVIGVPGQQRFAAVREALSSAVLLAVWVHRAGETACVDTTDLLARLRVPYLLLVNHHDPSPTLMGPELSGDLPQPLVSFSGDLHTPRPGLLMEIEEAIWRIADRHDADL